MNTVIWGDPKSEPVKEKEFYDLPVSRSETMPKGKTTESIQVERPETPHAKKNTQDQKPQLPPTQHTEQESHHSVSDHREELMTKAAQGRQAQEPSDE